VVELLSFVSRGSESTFNVITRKKLTGVEQANVEVIFYVVGNVPNSCRPPSLKHSLRNRTTLGRSRWRRSVLVSLLALNPSKTWGTVVHVEDLCELVKERAGERMMIALLTAYIAFRTASP
jgi:hypothetical protein